MACWVHECVVSLMIICDKKPVFKLKPEMSFDELYAEGRKNVRFGFTFGGSWTDKLFVGIEYTFEVMEKMGLVPFRRWGLKEAERWVPKRQEDSEEFLGYYPPMFYAMVCIKIWGYDVTHPVLHRALSGLVMFSIERKEHCVVQSIVSPVWDTALLVRALVESGLLPDHPAFCKAGEWLLEKQITKHIDWSYKSKAGYLPPGRWAFQFFKLNKEEFKNGAIACVVDWINTMQSNIGRQPMT
ncbi:hypothetical protein GOP47_0022284 [Adiantum capillus-veneris]|uniref:Squalene cyclase N-terminal domain-containing protein n=1 Tax=Adiantum capillus-veneris TaxID=13818 RepID=A0A9D4U9G0_ADICA|nr:hypothetical protein GOP47_0022284 [Adiantum capillus-veneris]